MEAGKKNFQPHGVTDMRPRAVACVAAIVDVLVHSLSVCCKEARDAFPMIVPSIIGHTGGNVGFQFKARQGGLKRVFFSPVTKHHT